MNMFRNPICCWYSCWNILKQQHLPMLTFLQAQSDEQTFVFVFLSSGSSDTVTKRPLSQAGRDGFFNGGRVAWLNPDGLFEQLWSGYKSHTGQSWHHTHGNDCSCFFWFFDMHVQPELIQASWIFPEYVSVCWNDFSAMTPLWFAMACQVSGKYGNQEHH